MSLVGQWQEIEAGLPEGWSDARLRLTVADAAQCDRAAALMGPAQPYRAEPRVLRFASARNGTSPGPNAIRRLLQRLDREGIRGDVELVASEAAPVPAAVARETLTGSWAASLDRLPRDWSDLYVEVELLSTDYVERAALLCSPLNPRREGTSPTLRFRCARAFGYGASPEMVRRCLERCDEAAIRGGVRVLRVMSDTNPVHTQGPVWHVAGRTV